MILLGHRKSLNATYSRIKMWEPETHLQRRCSIPTDPTVRVTRQRHPWDLTEHLTVFPMVPPTQGRNSRENQHPNPRSLQQEAISETRLLRFQNRFFSRRKTKPTKSRLFLTFLAAASKWEVLRRKIIILKQKLLLRLRRKEVWINWTVDWPRGKRLLRPPLIELCSLSLLQESVLVIHNQCQLLERLGSWIPQSERKRIWSHIQSHANHRFHKHQQERSNRTPLILPVQRTLWCRLRTLMLSLKTLVNRICLPLEVWAVTSLDLLL